MTKETSPKTGMRGIGLMALMFFAAMTVLFLFGDNRETSDTNSAATDGDVLSAAEAVETATASADLPQPVCVTRDGDPDALPSAACRAVIEEFLTRCMRAQMTLTTVGVTGLFEEASADALLNQAALDLTVAVRSLQPNDLTMTAATVGILYEAWEENADGTITVQLSEDDALQFSFLGGRESSSAGIGHIFVLSAAGDEVRILAHEREEDAFLLLEEVFAGECAGVSGLEGLTELGSGGGDSVLALASVTGDDALTAVREALARAQERLTEDAQETLAARADALTAFLADPDSALHPALTCDVAYDTAAALTYAKTWAGTSEVVRNPEWDVFDDMGGNCMNFVSQCLYAGGIPMDTVGRSCQWKYYGSEINGREQARGRSASWTGVNSFSEYALYNEGFGLAAWAGANDWAGRAGDALLLGVYGDTRHAVLITEVIYNDAGEPVDYLLASNTTDHVDFPASAYVYTSWEVVQILGYNAG